MRKLLLPLLSAALLVGAVLHSARSQQAPAPAAPPVAPARSPFARAISGTGLVEARTENISLGSALAGLVLEVYVPADKVGVRVKRGTPLFRVDDRNLRAERKFAAASLEAARAELAKLDAMPRPEEVPVSEAKVKAARAQRALLQDQFERARQLLPRRAISQEDYRQRQLALEETRQQLARTEAEHALLQAGAWQPDKVIARAAVAKAQARLEQIDADLERAVVRAPVEGEVLQVNVRPGEYVATPSPAPLVVLGDLRNLHVRVDIDDDDVPRFRPDAAARAYLRGNARVEVPLTFVRVEPFLVPKKSLTGEGTERVDTRVLRVIYALPAGTKGIYVGQQLDVFIAEEGDGKTPSSAGSPTAR
jgi:multidrug resistance efflux pump